MSIQIVRVKTLRGGGKGVVLCAHSSSSSDRVMWSERESQASSEQSVRDREQREDSIGQWRDRERGPGLKLTHNGGQVANTDTKLCCEAHFGM